MDKYIHILKRTPSLSVSEVHACYHPPEKVTTCYKYYIGRVLTSICRGLFAVSRAYYLGNASSDSSDNAIQLALAGAALNNIRFLAQLLAGIKQ